MNEVSDDLVRKIEIKRRATKFVVLKEVLYQCSLDGILIRCFTNHETHEAMSEVHSGLWRAHQLGPKIYTQLKRLRYY